MVFERVTRLYFWLFTILGVGLLASLAASLLLPNPEQPLYANLVRTPLVLLMVTLLWRALRTGQGITASKVFLTLASLILLIVRIVLGNIAITDTYLLLYYMEYLCFVVMMIAIALFELEFANRKISKLLEDKTRSEQDLQFIVDNSLDVILITDNVGLLQSWSNKAQSIFGYVPDQAVGKIHMDDLFANNYWGRDIGAAECFSSEMENVDGRRFPVEVRMWEVNDAGSKYHVFVVNVLEPKLGD